MRRTYSLVTAALLVVAPLTVTGATAEESIIDPGAAERTPALALVAFRDMPGGAQIMHGSYQRGLDEASAALAREYRDDKHLVNTNICVARLKLSQFAAANESCEAALDDSLPARFTMTPRQYLAVAHVNHGVVHFVQGDHDAARQEFRRAKSMDPTLRAAANNLKVTKQSMLDPRVDVVPRP